MTMHRSVTAAAVARAALFLMALPGIAYGHTASLDQFQVNRFDLPNSGAFFADPFEDGNPPPSAPNFLSNDSPAQYFVFGAIAADAESAGKLAVDSSLGMLITDAAGVSRRITRATLGTDVTTSTTFGLKRNHSFIAAARFDLVLLQNPGDAYGVELHDALGPGTLMESTLLIVRRNSDPTDTNMYLTFLKQDFAAANVPIFSEIVVTPPANANQIALFLRHGTPDTDTITAEYRYANSGTPLSDLIPLPGASTMFNGETFVRAAFIVVEVPEPGTYAMLLAGLAMLGWVARRRMQR
jgi:hypothetical protein